MPLYTYICTKHGHINDLVRPIGTDEVECPQCTYTAGRLRVNRVAVTQPEADTRGMYRRYAEASQEMSQMAGRQGVETPDLWSAAKARAQQAG